MDFIQITPRLHMLHFSIGQAYLWRDGEELTLVDAGWVGSAGKIEAALRGGRAWTRPVSAGSSSPTATATTSAPHRSSRTGTAPRSWPTASTPP